MHFIVKKGTVFIMKIVAVIAEYNPFHNGHLYQLNTIREELGADRIIVVMSGNFTQRGIPAIIDKFDRCRMALSCGADVVFELPAYFALGSAEYFAQGAVSLIDKLGVVDVLHFGSESGDINKLSQIAEILSDEPASFRASLKQYLRLGFSFPVARSKAIADTNHADAKAIGEIMGNPNNNLGIEYMKALNLRHSTIRPLTVTRSGSGYHETELLQNQFASANALRSLLSSQANLLLTDNALQDTDSVLQQLKKHVPVPVYNYFVDKSNQEFMFSDDFSTVLLYKLMVATSESKSLSSYFDISEQLSDIFRKNMVDFTTFSNFCLACNSKNLTYTRISRCLLHLLLDMQQETIDALKANDFAQYARLLGFRNSGKDVLSLIKANASIPVITKLSNAQKALDKLALDSLQKDIFSAQLYYALQGQKYHHTAKNEYTQEIIRV